MKNLSSFLLEEKDIKDFYADGKRYILYSPQNIIFAVNNEYFEKYIDLSLNPNNKNIKIDQVTLKHIHDYFFETIKQLGDENPPTKAATFQPSCVVLNISGQCNLLCSYCFARNSDGFIFGDMSLKTAIKAVDYMITNNSTAKHYTIVFWGGENPFLELK